MFPKQTKRNRTEAWMLDASLDRKGGVMPREPKGWTGHGTIKGKDRNADAGHPSPALRARVKLLDLSFCFLRRLCPVIFCFTALLTRLGWGFTATIPRMEKGCKRGASKPSESPRIFNSLMFLVAGPWILLRIRYCARDCATNSCL
jgi:hypothetical protein